MPISRVTSIFKPESVALFGASDRPGSLGAVLLKNLREAGFKGKVYPINPKHEKVGGRRAYPSLRKVRGDVDLAVIVTPAATIPDVIDECGEKGVSGAIIISAGFREAGDAGLALERRVVRRARRHNIRFLGPNCLGVIRPDIGFNATFSEGNALPGRIALVSQSGALCTAIIDWARINDVGFSSLISTGISADVDFGEILDFLVSDPKTDSIMLYIEGIRDARRFMSALRAAARAKPVVVMKAGREAEGAMAAVSHTGAMVGSDDVFDAALRRAGVLRVDDFAEFFSTAATLDAGVRVPGNRLALVTNAGGPGVMAADYAAAKAIEMASLSVATVERLDAILPASWSRRNPVDVLGDATPERYQEAVLACVADPQVDAVLAILTPQAMTAPLDVAQGIADIAGEAAKPIIACWMGGQSVAESRALFREHDVPSYRTPEAAVRAFVAAAAYRENQEQLLQVPEPLTKKAAPDIEGAKLIIETALAEHRRVLTLAESKAVLAAFGVPIVKSLPAHNANDAVLLAQEIGFPVVMKIHSPDITHKTDVDGVRIGINSAREVRSIFHEMTENVASLRPDARLDGVVIEPLMRRQHSRELMIGVVSDPVFGPAISFGLGGTMVEVIKDRAVALPPLNRYLAKNLIANTRAATYLGAFRGAPAANTRAVEDLLLHVSEMVCELPWLREMDMNPVVADESGAVVVDARIAIERSSSSNKPYQHMAIHPYPTNLVVEKDLPDGTLVTIRPIRPEDALIERDFVNGLSEQSRYLRFMYSLPEITPTMLSRFTQIDYDREMALIAVIDEQGEEKQIGVARYYTLLDADSCEFAIVVGDNWQGRGLATQLLRSLIETARMQRLKRMDGVALQENRNMRRLAESVGFEVLPDTEDPSLIRLSLDL